MHTHHTDENPEYNPQYTHGLKKFWLEILDVQSVIGKKANKLLALEVWNIPLIFKIRTIQTKTL